MGIEIRSFREEDFEVLLDLANQAVPFAGKENAEWLEARKAFNEDERVRRHYLALDSTDNLAKGYGCLEQQGDDLASMRIYVVCNPADLRGEIGEMLFLQLLQSVKELRVTTLWAREFQADEPIRQFFARQGFTETEHFTIPNYPPMVVFERQV